MSNRARAALGLLVVGFVVSVVLAVEGDVVLRRTAEGSGTPPPVFPHWVHRVRYRCYVCHPTPYAMKAGASEMNMDRIMAGESCGTCHNGKVAWGVDFDTCTRCHLEP